MRIVVLVLGEGARKFYVPSAPWSARAGEHPLVSGPHYEGVSRPPIFPEERGISTSNLFLPTDHGISLGTWNIPVPPTLEAPADPYTVARETAVPADMHSPLAGAAAVEEATQAVWRPNSLRLFDGDKILAARSALQNSAPLEYTKLRVNTTRSLPIDKFAAPAFATALLLADSRNFPVIESEFRRQVDHCWSQLEPLLGYLGKQETEYCIWPAVVVAVHSHFGQKRKSGEPYVIHPLAVAMFLAEIG